MHIFGLTIEGHGHNILVQPVPVEQEQTELDSQGKEGGTKKGVGRVANREVGKEGGT